MRLHDLTKSSFVTPNVSPDSPHIQILWGLQFFETLLCGPPCVLYYFKLDIIFASKTYNLEKLTFKNIKKHL